MLSETIFLAYDVDGRGNRTRAFERVAQSTTVSATYNKSASRVTFTRGTWTDAGDFKQTAQFSGRMQIAYTGDEGLLTIGTGPDHGQFDLYINDNYWHSFNTYTAQPGEQVIHLPQVVKPDDATTGKLSIEVRSDKHFRSTGRVFRFKQLAVIDTTYNERTIDYTYDGLSRLLTANYDGGAVEYTYGYDLAGNLTNNNGKTRTYNATNQLTNDGTHTLTYDANGNLTNDGTSSYTWDHANRLKSLGTTTYSYDGLGNRVQQAVGTTATNYLLDLQPGLTKVLAATTGANTERYIHSVRGIHAMQNNTGAWQYTTQDGLGSVRSLIDATLGVDTTHSYDPYGNYIGTAPTTTYFGFTGEQTDTNGQLFLRARYYNPGLGVFPSLDPFEGSMGRPMSLNGYSWVEGNVLNKTDPSGMQPITPEEMQRIFQEAERLAMELARGSGSVITEQILRQALRQALAQYGHLTSPQLEGQAVQHLTSTAVLARFGAAGLITSALIPTTRDGRICNAYNRTITNNCLPDLSRYWALNYEPQYQIGWQPVDLGDSCLAMPSPQTSPVTPPYRTQTPADTRTRSNKQYDYHIALGYERLIFPFMEKIERFYNPDGVYYWKQWEEPMFYPDGVPLVPPGTNEISGFPTAFFIATRDPRVSTIHFNLEDMIPDDYPSFTHIVENHPRDLSGQCDWNAIWDTKWSITAWEFCTVNTTPDLAAKTIFHYGEGS